MAMTTKTATNEDKGAIRNSTRYPSLGPSNSSPDSFRIAGTTPKNGNVCRKVKGQRIFPLKHRQRVFHGLTADPGFRGVAAGRGVITCPP